MDGELVVSASDLTTFLACPHLTRLDAAAAAGLVEVPRVKDVGPPRGPEFLFALRRLNVATFRAKAMAIVVSSPGPFRVFGRTPRQMQLVNRVSEMAAQA